MEVFRMNFPVSAELVMRQRFAEALTSGSPKEEVLTKIGIAQSTYYKWRKRWLQYGDAWVIGMPITKAAYLPGTTGRTSKRDVLELCLAMPTSSARSVSEQLVSERGRRIAPSTISNWLVQAKLNTRQLRADELYRRHQKGYKLTAIQKDLVRNSVDPSIAWKGDIAVKPGRILTQGIVTTHRDSPLGVKPIYVVVDTFDRRAFAMFPAERGARAQIQCLEQAIDEFGCSLTDVMAVFSDPHDEYISRDEINSYPEFLRSNRITHRLYFTTANKRNPMVWQVWRSLKPFLFEENRHLCELHKDEPARLNSLVAEFLASAR